MQEYGIDRNKHLMPPITVYGVYTLLLYLYGHGADAGDQVENRVNVAKDYFK